MAARNQWIVRALASWAGLGLAGMGLGLAGLGLGMGLAAPAVAGALPSYPALYAFGDGWSDAGNTWIASHHLQPAPPYVGGRYSNGAVWVQDLAAMLDLAAPTPSRAGGGDFAAGGALSGRTALHAPTDNDLPGQLAAFAQAVRGHAPAAALYTVSAGTDDLLAAIGAAPAVRAALPGQVAGNVAGFVAKLAALGARRVLVLGVPDLGRLPAAAALGAAAQARGTALANAYNAALRTLLGAVATFHGSSVSMMDVAGVLDAAIARPSTNHFDNVTAACWTGGVLANPHATACAATVAAQDAYLFWDPTHLTGRGHQVIGATATTMLP